MVNPNPILLGLRKCSCQSAKNSQKPPKELQEKNWKDLLIWGFKVPNCWDKMNLSSQATFYFCLDQSVSSTGRYCFFFFYNSSSSSRGTPFIWRWQMFRSITCWVLFECLLINLFFEEFHKWTCVIKSGTASYNVSQSRSYHVPHVWFY